MYGIFTYIHHKNQPNVGKYTIHGSYGKWSINKWSILISHSPWKDHHRVDELDEFFFGLPSTDGFGDTKSAAFLTRSADRTLEKLKNISVSDLETKLLFFWIKEKDVFFSWRPQETVFFPALEFFHLTWDWRYSPENVKNNGWKMIVPFWNGPFLGGHSLVFRGCTSEFNPVHPKSLLFCSTRSGVYYSQFFQIAFADW